MPEFDSEAGFDGLPKSESKEVLDYIADMSQSLAVLASQAGRHTLSEHLYHAAQKARSE